MNNVLTNKILGLFVSEQAKVQNSPGKKMLLFFTLMRPHQRLLFGKSGEFSSGAVFKINESTLDFYLIRYVGSDTFCYVGKYKGDNISWKVTQIKPDATFAKVSGDDAVKLEQELELYYSKNNIVESITLNDPRAGYFIPIY